MPAVGVAAVAAWAGASVAAVVSAATGGLLGALAYGLITAGVAAVVSYVGASVLGLNKRPGISDFNAEAQGRQVILRSAVSARRIIYGEAVVSGPLVYACKSGTEPSPVMHLVIALAGHECEEIGTVWLGDDAIESTDLGADGWVTAGKYYETANTPYAEAFNIATPFTATLTAVPVSVQSVTALVVEPGNDFATNFSLTDVSPATPASRYEYKRSGATFTFHAGLDGAQVMVNYHYTSGGTAHVRVKKYLGTATQTADQYLINASQEGDNSRWTSAHRGQGVAYIIVSLRRNFSLFPNGIPNIKAQVFGAKLYDPRTGLTEWSDNAALATYDYLTRADGLGCGTDELNETLAIAAANICDEAVDLTAGSPVSTQARYTVNGVITLDERPMDVLEHLCSAMAGAAVYSMSSWDLYAGAYSAPVHTIDEDDLRGNLTVQARPSRKDLFNAVRGTFVDPDHDWQPTDFPPVTNATYEAEDGDERVFRDIELRFTTDVIRAQRLAKIALERARQGASVTWPGTLACFRLNTWNTVGVSVDLLGYASKVFRVTGWKWDPSGGVDLVLQEEAATVYDWAYGEATTRDAAPDTLLPSVNTVPGTPGTPGVTETLVETTGSAGVKVLATIAWGESSGPYVRDYELQWKQDSDTAYQGRLVKNDTTLTLQDLAPGFWLFRVRAVNDRGVQSAWSEVKVAQLLGLSAAPSDVEEFGITPLGNGRAELSWKKHPDLDVRIGGRILIRWSPDTVAPGWNDTVPLVPDVPGDLRSITVPHLSGTYFARARDSSGNESANSVSLVTTVPDLAGYNAIDTITAEPLWTGTLTNTLVSGGVLTLAGADLIDDRLDDIDDWEAIDTLGGAAAEGTDDLTDVVDLGAVYTARVTAAITSQSTQAATAIDDLLEPVDAWGFIDGAEISGTSCDLFIATTDGDPAGSPTWSDWQPFVIGDYKCRGMKFRVRLRTSNSDHNIEVSSLVITVDMPDRENGAREVASGAGTYSVTYTLSPGFKTLPKIGVTAKNMGTGDYFTISSQTTSGFDIVFKNAAAAAVNRTFDWVAKGY